MNRSELGYFSFGDNLSDKVKIEYADSKNNTSLHTCAVCAAKISTLLCPDLCGHGGAPRAQCRPGDGGKEDHAGHPGGGRHVL